MKTISSWRVLRKIKPWLKVCLILKTFKKSKLQVPWFQIIFKKMQLQGVVWFLIFKKEKLEPKVIRKVKYVPNTAFLPCPTFKDYHIQPEFWWRTHSESGVWTCWKSNADFITIICLLVPHEHSQLHILVPKKKNPFVSPFKLFNISQNMAPKGSDWGGSVPAWKIQLKVNITFFFFSFFLLGLCTSCKSPTSRC